MVNIKRLAIEAVIGAGAVLLLREAATKGLGRAFAETGTGLRLAGTGVGDTIGSIGTGIGTAATAIGSGFAGLTAPISTIFDLVFAPSAGESIQPAQEQTIVQQQEVKSALANQPAIQDMRTYTFLQPEYTWARIEEAQRSGKSRDMAVESELFLQRNVAASQAGLSYEEYLKEIKAVNPKGFGF